MNSSVENRPDSLESYPLESRLFFVCCGFTGLGGCAAFLINLLAGNPVLELFFSGFAVAAALGFYFVGRRLADPSRLSGPLVIFIALLLAATWFSNQGSYGSVAFWYCPVFMFTAVILQGLERILVLGLLFLIVLGLAVAEWYFPETIKAFASPEQRYFDFFAVLLVNLLICCSLAAMITRTYRQERQRSQLFRQLLPICAECHKIRDDDGEWQQMEVYISENTGTDFSHGICPECAKQYYEAS